MLRIVQIGAGPWARYAHAPVLRRLKNRVYLSAICDPDPTRAEEFQQDFGYEHAFTSWEEALRYVRPDAFVVTTAAVATFDVVSALLPLRVPMLIEKPPGVDGQQADSLAALARESGTLTYVAFNRRRIPAVELAKSWAARNRVRFAHASMLRSGRVEPQFPIETGIHAVDCLRYLLGDIVQVSSERERNGAFAVLRFEAGATAALSLFPDCGIKLERYELFSDGAACRVTIGPPYSAGAPFSGFEAFHDGAAVTCISSTGDELIDGGFNAEYETFLHAVETHTEPDCCLADAAVSMHVTESVARPEPPK